jgi:Tfp pilus assembly protein PilF
VIGLVQVGSQSMADRYTYVPLIGLFIALAWGASDLVARWPRRSLLLRTGAMLALAGCAVTARAQVGHWRDTVTVWTHALEIAPDSARAHNNLGVALGLAGRGDEAFAHFDEAARIEPDYADAHYNLANELLKQNRSAQARGHYAEAIRIEPEAARAHFGLAICLAKEGELAQAVHAMTNAVRLEPENANFRYNLAVMLLGQGKRTAATRTAGEGVDPRSRSCQRATRAGSPARQTGVVISGGHETRSAARDLDARRADEAQPGVGAAAAARAHVERLAVPRAHDAPVAQLGGVERAERVRTQRVVGEQLSVAARDDDGRPPNATRSGSRASSPATGPRSIGSARDRRGASFVEQEAAPLHHRLVLVPEPRVERDVGVA